MWLKNNISRICLSVTQVRTTERRILFSVLNCVAETKNGNVKPSVKVKPSVCTHIPVAVHCMYESRYAHCTHVHIFVRTKYARTFSCTHWHTTCNREHRNKVLVVCVSTYSQRTIITYYKYSIHVQCTCALWNGQQYLVSIYIVRSRIVCQCNNTLV